MCEFLFLFLFSYKSALNYVYHPVHPRSATQRSELIFGTAPPLSGTLMLLFCQLPFANLAYLVILAILTLPITTKVWADTSLGLFHIQSIKLISQGSLSIAKVSIYSGDTVIQSSRPHLTASPCHSRWMTSYCPQASHN